MESTCLLTVTLDVGALRHEHGHGHGHAMSERAAALFFWMRQ